MALAEMSVWLLPLLLNENFPRVSWFRFLREESDWPNSSLLLRSQVIADKPMDWLSLHHMSSAGYAHLAEAIGKVGNENNMIAMSVISIMEGIFCFVLGIPIFPFIEI